MKTLFYTFSLLCIVVILSCDDENFTEEKNCIECAELATRKICDLEEGQVQLQFRTASDNLTVADTILSIQDTIVVISGSDTIILPEGGISFEKFAEMICEQKN